MSEDLWWKNGNPKRCPVCLNRRFTTCGKEITCDWIGCGNVWMWRKER